MKYINFPHCSDAYLLHITVVLTWITYACWQSKKKKRLRDSKNRQQELNTAWELNRNPSRHAAQWSEWEPVHKETNPSTDQRIDDIWVPGQPRSPHRQLSLYVDENFASQNSRKSPNSAKFSKRKTSNQSSQISRKGNRDNRQEELQGLDCSESSNSSNIQQKYNNAMGWPWKPIRGLTHNKISSSSLNTATNTEDTMKVWHDNGWSQLQDLHT